MEADENRAQNGRIRSAGRKLRVLAGVALLAGFGLTAHSAHAQTIYNFTVNTTADTPDVTPGDGVCDDATGKCSVRAATQEANALVPPAGGQIIVNVQIPANTYTLTLGELELLNNTINLNGAGASSTTVSGNHASRVFYIGCTTPSGPNCNNTGTITNAALASIQGVTITAGTGTGTRGRNGLGGGIFSQSVLTLVNDVVSSNVATGTGAADCFSNIGGGAGGGGGLAQLGFNPLTIQSTTFSGNKAMNTGASACGGGLYDYDGTTHITSSTFSANLAQAATDARGGAIWDDEQDVLTTSTLKGNQAVSTSLTAGTARGGGINNDSSLQVVQSTIAGNTASGFAARGGGIDNDQSAEIAGSSQITGNTASGVQRASGGGIENDDYAFLHGGVTVSQNASTTSGATATTSGCPLPLGTSSNACSVGGGITNYNYLNLQTTYVTLNKATASTATGVAAAQGGGLVNFAAGIAAKFSNIASNMVSATAPTVAGRFAQGGGIWNDNTPLNLQNSYVQYNSSPMDGGGIYDLKRSPGYISLSYSQVMHNTAGHEGGGVFNSFPVAQTASPIITNSAPLCPNTVTPCT